MQKNILNTIFIFSIFIGISSCASLKKKDEKLSLCECLKLVIDNPELKDNPEPPKGCVWLKELGDEDGQKLFMSAMEECPDIMKKLMEGKPAGQPAEKIENSEEENE